MTSALRIAPLALVLLPLLSQAQAGSVGAVGLEIPAPAPPRQGHFLAGAYTVGNYTSLPTPAGFGYAMQPYLRYQLGSSPTGRWRPFVQYTFAPYRVAANGAAQLYGTDSRGLPANSGIAPLVSRYGFYGGSSYSGYGGLGAFSVGIPMQVGRSSAVLDLGGSVVEGLLGSLLR